MHCLILCTLLIPTFALSATSAAIYETETQLPISMIVSPTRTLFITSLVTITPTSRKPGSTVITRTPEPLFSQTALSISGGTSPASSPIIPTATMLPIDPVPFSCAGQPCDASTKSPEAYSVSSRTAGLIAGITLALVAIFIVIVIIARYRHNIARSIQSRVSKRANGRQESQPEPVEPVDLPRWEVPMPNTRPVEYSPRLNDKADRIEIIRVPDSNRAEFPPSRPSNDITWQLGHDKLTQPIKPIPQSQAHLESHSPALYQPTLSSNRPVLRSLTSSHLRFDNGTSIEHSYGAQVHHEDVDTVSSHKKDYLYPEFPDSGDAWSTPGDVGRRVPPSHFI